MKFYCFFEIGEEPEKIKKTLNLGGLVFKVNVGHYPIVETV